MEKCGSPYYLKIRKLETFKALSFKKYTTETFITYLSLQNMGIVRIQTRSVLFQK
jgi:hypothetical protein